MVTITVTPDAPTADAPDAVDDTASVEEDTTINIDVLDNDTFGGDGPGTTPVVITVDGESGV